jgi:AhpD family alkylhydroperoxidase
MNFIAGTAGCLPLKMPASIFVFYFTFGSGMIFSHFFIFMVEEFNEYRAKMNEVILGKNNKVINRLFNLDTNTYAEGALSTRIKEMLGLVSSMVLRCDDCIKYHLGKCYEQGITTEEVYEIFAVANIVGGTIVIPHTRRGAEYWEELSLSKK